MLPKNNISPDAVHYIFIYARKNGAQQQCQALLFQSTPSAGLFEALARGTTAPRPASGANESYALGIGCYRCVLRLLSKLLFFAAWRRGSVFETVLLKAGGTTATLRDPQKLEQKEQSE